MLSKEDIFQMAIDSGLCDKDLSSADCLMTDYGSCNTELLAFAAMIYEKAKSEVGNCLKPSLDSD